MAAIQLIEELGYVRSGKFFTPANADLLPASELSFGLRQIVRACTELSARESACSFEGVYVLQQKPDAPAVPVIYVFDVANENLARKIHKVVWNQNLVPFIIVSSVNHVRVYPGFAFAENADNPLVVASTVGDLLGQLAYFDSASIDNGAIWQRWGHSADPSRRVDEKLLRDLKSLDSLLQLTGLHRETSHSLIGKFVYLYYLRHRNILSDRKLEKWGIDPTKLFGRDATINAFREVDSRLQTWLNGSVFQFSETSRAEISLSQLRLVAGVFCGDSPEGQGHLDFEAYDFSHIPIETLSCVYEQFLHDNLDAHGESRGRKLGAYYTPIPLADYVIAETDHHYPLKVGMRVLDPSCGSGTFLVECYRRLIERQMRTEGRYLKPKELREILIQSVFGIDRDEDACRIAELSLILTLLDYVKPPDLENTNFRLPNLRESNIFRADFFDSQGSWRGVLTNIQFDWIVGNPPWSEIKGVPQENHEHYFAWNWMTENKAFCPVGGNQIAEAFIWKSAEHLKSNGISGLVVPSSTWFKGESARFRQHFFSKLAVSSLANFANLAYVLFAGRAQSPASAIFFSSRPPTDDPILTFAPFVIEQVANRPQKANRKVTTWNIVINESELNEISVKDASTGNALFWKVAMWGSGRDERLLDSVNKRFKSFGQFCDDYGIIARQGVQFQQPAEHSLNNIEERPELVGKSRLRVGRLSKFGRIFSFPPEMVPTIIEGEAYIRKRSGDVGLTVSEPPHIIMDASRRFAVFSNEFIAIPHRQIGIAGGPANEQLLRNLSLYLSSDFSVYHQFFYSAEWGIGRSVAYLETLNLLPVPFLTSSDVDWQRLYLDLYSLSAKRLGPTTLTPVEENDFCMLLDELNSGVFDALRLRQTERYLVEDFVKLNMGLNKGKVTSEAKGSPTKKEIETYFINLRDCLDAFLSPDRKLRHQIRVVSDSQSAFYSVSLEKAVQPLTVEDVEHDGQAAKVLFDLREGLRQKHSQWIYFDRKLSIYQKGVFYKHKPLQRIHWTRRQAILDADDIIAESIAKGMSS